jgi:DNA-binding HxlR family transcriptional regulator
MSAEPIEPLPHRERPPRAVGGTPHPRLPCKENCPVANALDVIGPRWTLLIVHELLTREACRYTDLRAGLPGIATNLLATRLREMQEAGIVEREEAPPPIARTLYRLTPRGQALQPVLEELERWGVPLMREADRSP